MRIGCHISRQEFTDVTTFQQALHVRNADAVQTFLADPQGWKKPVLTDELSAIAREAAEKDIGLYIHAPYVLNVASTNNRIRIPSRSLLFAHAELAAQIGAKGLIVHGGHVTRDDDPEVGVANWRKVFENAVKDSGLETGFKLPILIENTAGGDNAMSRRLDSIAALWDAIGEFNPGFCLDTCHAHASGEELDTVVDRVKAITGRIDLVHANNSKDAAGSGRDRHANFADGVIDPTVIAGIVRAAGADSIVETPWPEQAQAADIAYLRENV